jgi:hypothetical protein
VTESLPEPSFTARTPQVLAPEGHLLTRLPIKRKIQIMS